MRRLRQSTGKEPLSGVTCVFLITLNDFHAEYRDCAAQAGRLRRLEALRALLGPVELPPHDCHILPLGL
jgi:hypothetical protein